MKKMHNFILRHRTMMVVSLSLITYHLSFTPAVAQVTDRSGVKDVNQVVDNTPDSIAKAMTARPVPGSSRKGNNPVLFLIGNSTMRTGTLGNGNNGQWGWATMPTNTSTPPRLQSRTRL